MIDPSEPNVKLSLFIVSEQKFTISNKSSTHPKKLITYPASKTEE